MKKIILFTALIMVIVSCNCQKKAVENNTAETKKTAMNAKIEYQANTRGFFEKITIQDKSVTISKDRNSPEKGVTTVISDKDWNELVKLFSAIKLDDLKTYKDPTQKRFYDGAAIADLKIIVDDKEFQTTSFDHGFPPVEIEKLVNKIVALGEKE